MISGTVALLMSLPAQATPASPSVIPADAAALIARLALPGPSDTPFTEVRFAAMLKQPLVLHGELHYGGPTALGKRVDAPYHETLTIDGERVEVQRQGRDAKKFSLQRAPELQGLLASFSALLAGDADTLARHYDVALTQDAAHWRLTLTPRSADLRKHIRDVVVDGSGNQPRCFRMHDADNDVGVTLLGAAASGTLPNPPTPAALDGICQAP